MKDLKVKFEDFWAGFDGDFFIWILNEAGYNVKISNDPDLLIYSVFGKNHERYTCKKVFFTGENIRPPAGEYALSFDFSNDPKHYRFPLYAWYRWSWATEGGGLGKTLNLNLDSILQPKLSREELFKKKTKFCTFIQRNPSCQHRNNFFNALNSRKKVDSAGIVLNNTGFLVENKLEFINDYKFNIAFENSRYPGYVTEKIFEPMLMGTIPLYWGSPTVNIEFNEKSFVNLNEMSIDEAVETVIQLDENDDLYYEMYSQPFLADNKLNEWMDLENLSNFLKTII
jgi:hypothetical protein